MSLVESLVVIQQEALVQKAEREVAYKAVRDALDYRLTEERPFIKNRLIRYRGVETTLNFDIGGSDFTLLSAYLGGDDHQRIEVIIDHNMVIDRRMKEKVRYVFNKDGILLSKATGWEKGAPEHFKYGFKPVDPKEARKLAKFLNDFTDESLQEYKTELVKQYEESIAR